MDQTLLKPRAETWFKSLRDEIFFLFETLEQEAPQELYDGEAAVFSLTPWTRNTSGKQDEGGGIAGILRGRFFEKAGVHISTVHGQFEPEFARHVQGAEHDPHFWATGLSLIAHPRSPRVPAVHMNTRLIMTTQSWFGGGADLTPVLSYQRDPDFEDAKTFHLGLKQACDKYDASYYPDFKAWCDKYFYLPHRQEPRGIGGIFFDHLNTGQPEKDLSFVQEIGTCFKEIYAEIARRRMHESWTEEDREEQLIRRGRYVEFNLLYDRGTQFGLKTGGNTESILSSLPPLVKWP